MTSYACASFPRSTKKSRYDTDARLPFVTEYDVFQARTSPERTSTSRSERSANPGYATSRKGIEKVSRNGLRVLRIGTVQEEHAIARDRRRNHERSLDEVQRTTGVNVSTRPDGLRDLTNTDDFASLTLPEVVPREPDTRALRPIRAFQLLFNSLSDVVAGSPITPSGSCVSAPIERRTVPVKLT